MTRPKVFLSSTCYDMSLIRKELDKFLDSRGFDVLNSESRRFGVSPGVHSHDACLAAVDDADYLVLLIGSRRGGTFVGSEDSITNEEFRRAEGRGIPIIGCVERKVWDYIPSFRKNPASDHSHVVDDERVFLFIDYVSSGHADNWLHIFESVEDLREIIESQMAHYLVLYSRSIRKNEHSKPNEEDSRTVGVPADLSRIDEIVDDQDEATILRGGIVALHSIMKKILESETKLSAKTEKMKQLWVMARFGELCFDDQGIRISMNNFKQYAWSHHKARRVGEQLKDFGVNSRLGVDEECDDDLTVSFESEGPANAIAGALKTYVQELVKLHGEKRAFNLFCRLDMRCFSK